MDSPGRLQGHLDATADRDVVYCHSCSNEWYRDDHGLQCPDPDCGSDATEIISLDNDPRDFNDDSASTSPELHHHSFPYGHRDHDHGHDHEHDYDHDHDHEHGHEHDHDHEHEHDHHRRRHEHRHNEDHFFGLGLNLDQDHDSDPGEADIEEHLGPHGFHYRRSVRDRSGYPHHDPDVDPVLERFLGMIQDFAPIRRAGAPGVFQQRGEEGRYAAPQIQRTTFMTGSGTASVTIFTGNNPGFFGPGSPGLDHHGDPFQTFFSNVLRDVGPPGAREAGGPTPGFARGLQEILNLFNPANAVAGDAVYSQEALDQIITNLMEAHPQSNAAPPASNEALANLDRRPVDASMLDGDSKTECTICIDDMKVGDLAAFLPCKHWFHEECVVLWLKEHNTCPVCRASIEVGRGSSSNANGRAGANANANNANANARASASASANASSSASASANAPGSGGLGFSQPEDASGSGLNRSGPLPIPGARPPLFTRPPGQSQSRLNEAMRGISSLQQERRQQQQQDRARERHRIWGIPSNPDERQSERERERDRIWGVPSSMSNDASRTPRRNSRNSLSPTSPRMSSFADYRVRQRQGSPQPNSHRDGGNADSSRQTSSGPFGWLRDRFAGGGSRDDSNRDER
ncbi:hypothetical protein Trco_004161 [Trichoderma cornu-damae]|uniref:RING-type E3 ubiquitin transferase n=1 Tax=Trichoderma cornu-damae TaxID=654480 RepID=A0A9P8QRD3_9HYPO|nr:hypothetical protein Trco_004161 [Trichoderma cornu-damae]